MITIKIKYNVESEDDSLFIGSMMKQYSSLFHVLYNLKMKDKSLSDISLRNQTNSTLNNIDLLDSYMRQCCLIETKSLIKKTGNKKVIFGGRKNFFNRMKSLISKEEYKNNRLSPIYCIGEGTHYHGNRKFRIQDDLESIIYKPNKNHKIKLNLSYSNNRYKDILKRLYIKQLGHDYPITFMLDKEYVYILFDETELYKNDYNHSVIENRTMSIDLNPNYVGWSIVDWKDSSDFNVVKSGVISLKELNDKEIEFKKEKHLSSESKERVWLKNKRKFETLEISKKLIDIALYYKVQLFGIEELNIETKDLSKGKNLNRLINNNWCRNALTNNLRKRCNIFKIKFIEVKPQYSSFIGNFLFRNLEVSLPDMCLASIEIGRRAYEFYNQYITKIKEIKKNIIKPDIGEFKSLYIKSLEEFGIMDEFKDMVELYYFIKNSKRMYRVPFDENQKFYRQKSKKSYISSYLFI